MTDFVDKLSHAKTIFEAFRALASAQDDFIVLHVTGAGTDGEVWINRSRRLFYAKAQGDGGSGMMALMMLLAAKDPEFRADTSQPIAHKANIDEPIFVGDVVADLPDVVRRVKNILWPVASMESDVNTEGGEALPADLLHAIIFQAPSAGFFDKKDAEHDEAPHDEHGIDDVLEEMTADAHDDELPPEVVDFTPPEAPLVKELETTLQLPPSLAPPLPEPPPARIEPLSQPAQQIQEEVVAVSAPAVPEFATEPDFTADPEPTPEPAPATDARGFTLADLNAIKTPQASTPDPVPAIVPAEIETTPEPVAEHTQPPQAPPLHSSGRFVAQSATAAPPKRFPVGAVTTIAATVVIIGAIGFSVYSGITSSAAGLRQDTQATNDFVTDTIQLKQLPPVSK